MHEAGRQLWRDAADLMDFREVTSAPLALVRLMNCYTDSRVCLSWIVDWTGLS